MSWKEQKLPLTRVETKPARFPCTQASRVPTQGAHSVPVTGTGGCAQKRSERLLFLLQ